MFYCYFEYIVLNYTLGVIDNARLQRDVLKIVSGFREGCKSFDRSAAGVRGNVFIRAGAGAENRRTAGARRREEIK